MVLMAGGGASWLAWSSAKIGRRSPKADFSFFVSFSDFGHFAVRPLQVSSKLTRSLLPLENLAVRPLEL
jgi:hypothetical protein